MNLPIVCLLAAVVMNVQAEHHFHLMNQCSFPVWPAFQSNQPNLSLPMNGGFRLDAKQSLDFPIEDGWSGVLWARTGCSQSGRCDTGTCAVYDANYEYDKIQCSGSGSSFPVTIAGFKLDQNGGTLDQYEVSLLDGYNIAIVIKPIHGTFQSTDTCQPAGCFSDLNDRCPDELAVRNDKGRVVACRTACQWLNNDEYCCRGAQFGNTFNCRPDKWKVKYVDLFRQECSMAKIYPFDNVCPRFACKSDPKTGFTVLFCNEKGQ